MSLASVKTNSGAEPMQIDTRFGLQEIDPDSILNFPGGLPGFEDLRHYKLFHEEGTHTLLYLQSVEDPGVQFPLVDPDHFQVNYEITLNDEELSQLQLEDPSEAVILVTVSRADDSEGAEGGLRANFMGPIILNTKARTGMQKSLNNISGSVVIKAD